MVHPPASNPFRPGFGRMPDQLIGRGPMLDEFTDALVDGGGTHFLVSGHRGMGKTVLMQACTDIAREHGWLVLADDAGPGLTDRLTNSRIPHLLRELDGGKTTTRAMTGLSMPHLGGVTTTVRENYPATPTFDMRVTELLDKSAQMHTSGQQRPGVLIAVDEIEPQGMDDLRQIVSGVQLLTRDRAPVVFMGAALSHNMEPLMDLPHTTFLRRAQRFELSALDRQDVARNLDSEFSASGRRFTPEALELTTGMTGQHPYLVQLVGRQVWDASTPGPVSAEKVRDTVPEVVRLMGQNFHRPALVSLSERQADFVEAMARRAQPTPVADIADDLDISRQRGYAVREALETKGLVERDPEGKVQFTLPFLADYVNNHGAHHGAGPSQTPTTRMEDLLAQTFPHSIRDQLCATRDTEHTRGQPPLPGADGKERDLGLNR